MVALLLVIGTIFLAGCKKDEVVQETELPVVRYISYPIYDSVFVGVDKGLFEKHGIKVELTSLIAGGPNAIQAVAGGNAEAGLSSIMGIINARGAGLPIVGVADLQSAREESALEEFFVRADSDIADIDDLRGKKLATNLLRSSFHYTILMALEASGIKEDEVEFVLLPFQDQATALHEGHVDMIGLMQPHIAKAEDLFEIKPLFDALDVFGEKQFSLIFVNKIWAENNSEQATAFVAGIADAIDWLLENQEDAKAIISKYTNVEEQYIEDYFYQEDGKVNIQDCQFWLEYMKGRGELSVDWLKVEDFATNKYNERIK